MNKLYVRLTSEELQRLGDMARADRRNAADQAAYIIAQHLKQTTVIQQPATASA